MHSMTQDQPLVIGGVDAHADTHHFAALDYHGALLATKAFPASTPGYAEARLAPRLRLDPRSRDRVDWLLCFRARSLPTRARNRGARGQPTTRSAYPTPGWQKRPDRC
jgi:hypothetical protein